MVLKLGKFTCAFITNYVVFCLFYKPQHSIPYRKTFLFQCYRYVELEDGKAASGVPGTTPFIHRDTNFFLLEDLKPDTEYSVDVYLIPVPFAEQELASDDVLTFRTKGRLRGKLNDTWFNI